MSDLALNLVKIIGDAILVDTQQADADLRESPGQQKFQAQQIKRSIDNRGERWTILRVLYENHRHNFYMEFAKLNDEVRFELLVNSKSTRNFCELTGFTFSTNVDLVRINPFRHPMQTSKNTQCAKRYRGKTMVVLVKPQNSAVLKLRDFDNQEVPSILATVRNRKSGEYVAVFELSKARVYQIDGIFELEAYAIAYDWLSVQEDNLLLRSC